MATTTQLTVDANTIALYHMDGTAGSAAKVDNAEGTASRDLVENNVPTSSTGQIIPTSDGAYDLDGASQYLSVADDASFDGQTNFTVEFWLNPDATGEDDQPISKFGATVATNQSWRTIFDASNHLFGEVGNGTTVGTIATATAVSTGAWTYFALTYDGSQALGSRGKLYINGVDATTADTTPNTMLAGTAQFIIGNRDGFPGGGFYNGKVDEIRISNKTRTSTEISNYYNDVVASGGRQVLAQSRSVATRQPLSSPRNSLTTSRGTLV